jgi:hypothetical protein
MTSNVTTQVFAPGGYRFIPAVFQYSGGVAAEPEFQIERVVLPEPLPLAAGFERVEALIAGRGRPPTAFCACELRSPLPFSDDGFRAFNKLYVETLAKWGIYDGTTNPVARSNVCPEIAPPPEPCLYAFCFTVPSERRRPTFVVAGSGEAREGACICSSGSRRGSAFSWASCWPPWSACWWAIRASGSGSPATISRC